MSSDDSIQELKLSLYKLEKILSGFETSPPAIPGLEERLVTYLGICRKQLEHLKILEAEYQQGHWAELNKQVSVIGGLAQMVKDDALCWLTNQQVKQNADLVI